VGFGDGGRRCARWTGEGGKDGDGLDPGEQFLTQMNFTVVLLLFRLATSIW